MIDNDLALQHCLDYQAQLQLIITGGDTSSLHDNLRNKDAAWAQGMHDTLQQTIDEYNAAKAAGQVFPAQASP